MGQYSTHTLITHKLHIQLLDNTHLSRIQYFDIPYSLRKKLFLKLSKFWVYSSITKYHTVPRASCNNRGLVTKLYKAN